MAEEKIVILNMRKELTRTRRRKRGSVLVGVLRKKIQKMYKDQRIIIDRSVNEKIWKTGIKNPRFKLKVTKIDENTVRVELGK